jgi:Na+-driven multidrug efflux pump
MSQAAPGDKFGVVSLILGVVALITSWVLIGVFFGVAAVVTGLVARAKVKRTEESNARTAMAGIVLGAVAIVLGMAAVGYYFWFNSHTMDHYHQCLVDGTNTHC